MELRWIAVLASVGAHAVALAAVARAPVATRPAVTQQPFEVSVQPVPPPEPVAPTDESHEKSPPAPAVKPKAPRRVASIETPRAPAPTPEATPEATPAAPKPTTLSMRGTAPPKPAVLKEPEWWRFGKPDGPEPSDRLSAAQMGGPIRPPDLPGPLYRTGVPTQAERLGDRVVADGDGGYREDHTTFKARVDRDGAVHFENRGNLQVDTPIVLPIGFLLGGHFDITDKLMMMHGEDPYRYEKAKFMERTRDERMAMSLGVRSERMGAAVARMPKYLESIWRDEKWTVPERKLALYSLWEEVAEDGDDELVATGGKIRQEICAFIRRRLPTGSADGYTSEELAALNGHRKCKARFEPYAESR